MSDGNDSQYTSNIHNKSIKEKKDLIDSLTHQGLTESSFSLLCQLSEPTEDTSVKIYLLNNLNKLKLCINSFVLNSTNGDKSVSKVFLVVIISS